ncbi:ketoacyl-synt-domain-containing protein [Macroventuria anomochaeta]|uniref:Ketoacyl-synt-domain-containing protein n=1 Tax=Macroventuria anomochaeta TaxID=301207 RepID=A0ACB6S4T7_9PLEO|nr:ketoacyl-synt-domain-containing protein [Macroventuria anomochaeta]KAF2629171.1 ketoacyl-synt-domain-containing protein [Macroventuria anomochaeta]
MRLHLNDRPNEPIAVIGSGFRFPGGTDTSAKLWDLLREPRDVRSTIPVNRFNPDGFFHSANDRHGTSNTRHGYFLSEDLRQFDAQFFGIKPVEASSMDPQQRLLLEVIYEGIEAAGLSMENLRGSMTAVYIGLMAVGYGDLLNRDTSDFPPYMAAGTARSMISDRVSYFFDWRGPSMTIDTACSSSLVAVHQAVQSLRLGESQVAVAAGANLLLGPEQFIAGSNMKMLSPDGHSYMWDTRANGYARGEGVAAIVLKTLKAAIADGDDIECVIVETGLNQDGKTKGITVPSAAAQATLIETTYRKAGLDLTQPSGRPQYFEAHGTGTPTGDPIEAEAIHSAFFKHTETRQATDHLYVGSIKTVIGHTEGAAGLAGLIKASLALKHGIIPPNLLFENLAPAVKPFYDNLEITTTAKPWPALAQTSVRRASVNSFGFGGANAHCILESYCHEESEQDSSPVAYIPFMFSAPSEKALSAVVASYSNHLRSEPSVDLRALSHTLCTKRSVFSVRVAFSATNVGDLCTKLDSFLQGMQIKPIVAVSTYAPPPRILGIFTGQGAQWAGMASKLMRFSAAAQLIEELEQSLAELQDAPLWSLKAELSANKSSSRITDAALAQPACTAVQILLVKLLRAAGIHFSAVVGHSSGEIAAAYASGYLSARDAIRIAYYRGVHLQLVGGRNGETGAMMAIGASFEEAQNICSLDEFRGKICVAASNSASSVTLSGDTAAIESAKAMFQAKNRFARVLRVDNAYHSHHMMRCSEAITASLRACKIASRRPNRSNCLWVSSVYQRDITMVTESLDDLYWHSNTVSPVLFSQALDHLLQKSSFDLAVEVGAHPALKGPASQVIEGALGHTIPYTAMLSRNEDDIGAFSDGLGYIWANLGGNIIDFAGYDRTLNASEPPRMLKGLPTYPWDHHRAFWHESRASNTFRLRRSHHQLLGIRNPDYSGDHMSWKNYLVPNELSWVSGHRIQGQLIFPGAGYISSAFEAAREVAAERPVKLIELTNFLFGQPLVFHSEDSRVEVVLSLAGMRHRNSTLTAEFTYHSIANKECGPMSLNASGQLNIIFGDPDANSLRPIPESQFGMTEVDPERIYSSFFSCGYHYTGVFKALVSVKRKLGVASGLVQVSEMAPTGRLLVHPATLDAAMQSLLIAYCYPGDGRLTSLPLPTGVSRISINPTTSLSSSCERNLRFVSYSKDDGKRTEGDVDLYPADGSNAMLQLEGLRTKPLVPATSVNDIQMFSETVWGPASPVLGNTLKNHEAIRSCPDEYIQIMSATARQISHRYPAMKILEISARETGATKFFLTELDDAFASYTYTDISDEYLDQARTVYKAYDDRMIYKILDKESDVVDQGYSEHSFDLVVAFSISQKAIKLDRTMRIIRQLLKPGGYLLCQQPINIEQTRSDSTLNTASDSRSSHDGERPPSPFVDVLEWMRIIKKHGFADGNSTVETMSSDPFHHSVRLIQVVDNRIQFLREPLVSTEGHSCFSGITLVGGASSATSACMSDLTGILQTYGGKITQAEKLQNLVDADLHFGGAILLLQDHDKPFFEGLDYKNLKGLQKLFEKSKNVLWVTYGYKCGLPHARMLVAFARCLLQEMPHVRLQILDLPSSGALVATLISKHLLRLLVTARWEEQGHLHDILWSFEPEISHETGQNFIPRVKLSKSLNSRYNSARRLITESVDPSLLPVALSVEAQTYALRSKHGLGLVQTPNSADIVTIRVTHSLLKAVKIESCGFFYLLVGTDIATHEQVVALSSTLSSEVDVYKGLVRVCSLPRIKTIEYIHTLFYGLISYTALRDLHPGDSLLVLEPDKDFAAVLGTLATAQGIRTVFYTASHGMNNQMTWKTIPFRASKRDVNAALPHNLSRVVCWQDNDWSCRILQNIPSDIPIDTLGFYVGVGGSPLRTWAMSGASDMFDRMQDQLVLLTSKIESKVKSTLSLADVHGFDSESNAMRVVDWMTTSKVPVTVEPVDQRALFRRDRTYWLVGLTGGLGLSLCEWMISRGAKNIVLSSRNPKIDPRWLTHFESLDATVRVYANDITDHESVKSIYSEITRDMPPVAGVCHGAMVIQDALVQDLDMSRVEKVLKPKVNGAIHLDEVFQHQTLDFFVMLSSIAAITGNPGQAAYAAANGFLAGLATQRRLRGLPASTVNLGAILGNGYATRGLTLAQQVTLQKAGVMWTSEQDFHSAFAEAVVASSPHASASGEFTTGVRICYADEDHKPKHASSPIFSHLVLQRNVSTRSIIANEPVTSVKSQLLHVTTVQATIHILEGFLTSKLRKALQMSPDADVINQTADSLGIDSLVAVEMRSWLMKELNVDMPVLKIIGGGTMREVLGTALELLILP